MKRADMELAVEVARLLDTREETTCSSLSVSNMVEEYLALARIESRDPAAERRLCNLREAIALLLGRSLERGSKRRTSLRAPVEFATRFHGDPDGERWGLIRELGERGAAIRTANPLPVGSAITGVVLCGGESGQAAFSGTVRWTSEPPAKSLASEMGIEFTERDDVLIAELEHALCVSVSKRFITNASRPTRFEFGSSGGEICPSLPLLLRTASTVLVGHVLWADANRAGVAITSDSLRKGQEIEVQARSVAQGLVPARVTSVAEDCVVLEFARDARDAVARRNDEIPTEERSS